MFILELMAFFSKKNKIAGLIFCLPWILLFLWLWPQLFFERDGGIFAGNSNLWADWAAHMSYASVFAFKSPSDWFTHHPIFVFEKFNYPFITSLISGFLIKAGVTKANAFLWPTLITTIFFFGFLARFLKFALGKSRDAAIAMNLFLLSGGLGFLAVAQDFWDSLSDGSGIYSTREATHLPDFKIEFINVLTSEFVPQRAFFLGLPLALWILVTLGSWYQKNFESISRPRLVGLGFAIGLLCLVHTHSVLALSLIVATLFLMKPKPLAVWIPLGLSSFFFGLIFYLIFLKGRASTGYFSLHPGWMADPGLWSFVKFWWFNWGLFLPLAFYATIRLRQHRNPWVVAGFVLFAVSNLFQFSPWIWDNTKILTWAYLLLTIPVSQFLMVIWNSRRIFNRLVCVIFFAGLIASGLLDVIRLFQPERSTHQMWSKEDLKLAEDFQKISSPSDIILASPQNVHHWAARLTGRQVLLGYVGTAWSYGFPYAPLEADIRKIYAGSNESLDLLRKYQVRFVSVGLSEVKIYGANEAYFRDHFEKILENDQHRVYQVSSRQ